MDTPQHVGPPGWLDGDPEPDTARGRRPILLVLAVLPWLVVLGMVATPHVGDATPAPASVRSGDTALPSYHAGRDDGPGGPVGTSQPDGTAQPGATGPPDRHPAPGDASLPTEEETGWWITEHRGNWRIDPGDGATASLATAVARAWLTGLGPHLAISGIVPDHERSYVEHLVVEAVERPADGAAVVTLLAVVLDSAEDERSVDVRRLAVPIAETDVGPRPAGSPWRLPAPDLTPAPLVGETVEDPELSLAALDALETSGLADGGRIELTSLVRTSGWPWIAHVRVQPSHLDPDAASAWEAAVWLRRHLDGFSLTGVPSSSSVTAAPSHEGGRP
jgi:hypothetical protein